MSGHTRRATLTDAADLKACIADAYLAHKGISLPDVTAGIQEDILANLVWVYVQNGKIVGGIIVKQDAPLAHLQNLAVLSENGGQGIGSSLINTALVHLKAQGFQEVRLATHIEMPQNVKVYAHLGWTETGREGDKIFMTRQI